METIDIIGLVIVISYTSILFVNGVILETLRRILRIFQEEEDTIEDDDD